MQSLKEKVTYTSCASGFFSWDKVSKLHHAKSFFLESKPSLWRRLSAHLTMVTLLSGCKGYLSRIWQRSNQRESPGQCGGSLSLQPPGLSHVQASPDSASSNLSHLSCKYSFQFMYGSSGFCSRQVDLRHCIYRDMFVSLDFKVMVVPATSVSVCNVLLLAPFQGLRKKNLFKAGKITTEEFCVCFYKILGF